MTGIIWGETLVKKQITVNDPPEYIDAGKGGTDRYTLSGEEYKCRFWISEGGLSIVRDVQFIENKIKAIKKGEVIDLKIRRADEPRLQSESARLMLGCSQIRKPWLPALYSVPKDRY